jgi:hypothetical protein
MRKIRRVPERFVKVVCLLLFLSVKTVYMGLKVLYVAFTKDIGVPIVLVKNYAPIQTVLFVTKKVSLPIPRPSTGTMRKILV